MKFLIDNTKFSIFLIAGMVLLSSCSDELEFHMPEPDDMIVIDGWIENGEIAHVLLTKNTPFFTSIDSSSLRELVLTRAKVTIDNGIISENLILRKNEDYFPPYIYQSNKIKGEVGGSYTITAEFGGKKAFATTTIPESVGLDTLYFELAEGEDSLGILKFEFTDPSFQKNYYRFFTKRVGKDPRFISSFIMALNDQYFSGKKTEFSLFRSPESPILSEKHNYFEIGDTVLFKLSTMDRESFEFWSSFQDEVLNSNNPFASSMIKLESNINGDGLGVWSGYGSTVYQLVIKKPDVR